MSERIEYRIERFIRTGEGDFGSLALELFAYQFERNLPYQAFCRAQNYSPSHIRSWQDIPAVPIAAFKSTELTTFPVNQAAAVFHSSGTTQKTPSRHFLKSLSYYETSLLAGFEKWVKPSTPMPFIVLAPSPAEAPRSSLSWMLDVVSRKWGASGSGFFIQRGFVQDWPLFKALDQAQKMNQPVVLLGTTLAFLSLFDLCEKRKKNFACAPGSRLMDTGGMKTQTREVTREDFVSQVGRYLGISKEECISEYGMCEMSSQFYTRGLSRVYQGPAWVRTQAIDAETGQALPPGQTGLLRHFDLANVDSVLALQTEDEGDLRAVGFFLKGRAAKAELKGCSLDLERHLVQ